MRLGSLRAKLTGVTVSTAVVALAVLSVGMGAYHWQQARRALRDQIALQTAVVAHGCTAAVAFGDAAAAREALAALHELPGVLQAAVYGPRGEVVAEYRTAGATAPPPAADADSARVEGGEATAFHGIWLDGERIGGVYVRASTAAIEEDLRSSAAMGLLVSLLAVGAASAVWRRLQRGVMKPLLDLTRTVDRIATSRDHGLRAPVGGADEVGLLAAGFNGMLDALQQRDAELDRQRRTLEQTVVERTAELAEAKTRLEEELAERKRLHEQLTHAQKMEAVGRLAGGIAHDFNNILAVVSLYAGELVDTLPEGSDARSGAMEIEAATERAVALTRQLLAFSRKQVLKPEVLDTGAVVTNISKMIARLIGAEIELTVRVGEGLGPVFMDPAQLEQVLVNLAVNARDAMPRGGRLVIEAEDVVVGEAGEDGALDLAPGRWVRVRVADTGVGMDAATRARAFEPFFTTKAKGRGTGLGLAMVYGAVEGAGGSVTVETAPGRGATFSIHLPRAAREAAARAGAAAEPPAGRGERVLLVEDGPQVRAAVARMLSRAGYAVVEASDGEEGLQQHERAAGAIDLVVTDLVMPGMSGLALGARLRERDASLPIVYMSGYSEELLADRSLAPDQVFSKPLDERAVLARVRHLLDTRARPAAGAAR